MLKACLNGGRLSGVPMTPAAYAAEAVRCFARGVSAVHVHPRDAEGRESLDAQVIAACVRAIRQACPELPVGVTTGAWIEPDPSRRVEAVRDWAALPSHALPDFASVNVHEAGAEDVASVLRELGVGVEAGVWTVEAAQQWRRWRAPSVRVLLECMEETVEAALANARSMLDVVGADRAVRRGVLLHGEGSLAWAVLQEAVSLGLDTRIGLEDTLVLPDGGPAPDNAALVAAAVALGAR